MSFFESDSKATTALRVVMGLPVIAAIMGGGYAIAYALVRLEEYVSDLTAGFGLLSIENLFLVLFGGVVLYYSWVLGGLPIAIYKHAVSDE